MEFLYGIFSSLVIIALTMVFFVINRKKRFLGTIIGISLVIAFFIIKLFSSNSFEDNSLVTYSFDLILYALVFTTLLSGSIDEIVRR